MTQIKKIGSNQREISYTKRTTFLYSYETPVAVRIKSAKGVALHVTCVKWNNTTNRHISDWVKGSWAIVNYVPQRFLDDLAAKQRYAAEQKSDGNADPKVKRRGLRVKTIVVYRPTTLMMLPLKQPIASTPQLPTSTEGESVPNKKVYKVWAFEGSGKEPYQTLQYEDASLSCNCPGWTRRVANDGSRSCKHTRLVQMDMADGVALKATVIDGSLKPIILGSNSKSSMTMVEAGKRAMRFEE